MGRVNSTDFSASTLQENPPSRANATRKNLHMFPVFAQAGPMQGSARKYRHGLAWLLGGGLGGLLLLIVLGAVFLPLLIVRWLGGDEFRTIASQQPSSVLKTEGELEPLAWSSFSVYSEGFTSRTDARGPWLWDIRSIRAEISPRLLLDRILRFTEITAERIQLRATPGSSRAGMASTGEGAPSRAAPSGGLLEDVQIKKLEIRSLEVAASQDTGGWGLAGMKALIYPEKNQADFQLEGGRVVSPYPWLGSLQIQHAKGKYVSPTLFLSSLEATSSSGGALSLEGDFTPGEMSNSRGTVRWSDWPIPPAQSSFGLVKIQGKMQGTFHLEKVSPAGISGKGQVELREASFQTDPSVRASLQGLQNANDFMRWLTSHSVGLKTSTFDILSGLADDPRWSGARLSVATMDYQVSPGAWELNHLLLESPGFLRVQGQILVQGSRLAGRIFLGIDPQVGKKINEFTYGQCFLRMESGYLVEPIEISGTLQQPQNNFAQKISSAAEKRATEQTVRTVGAILQKVGGGQPASTPAGAAGQILNSLFGPPPGK